MKRLCVVMPSRWESGGGGAQYQVKCLIEALSEHEDLAIYYVTRDSDGAAAQNGYELVNLADSRQLAGYNRLFLDSRRLYAKLKQIRPDCIYLRGLTSYAGVAARYAKSNGCRQVLHVAHDYEVTPLKNQNSPLMGGFGPFVRIERAIGEYGLRNSSFVIAQTMHQAELLERYFARTANAVIGNFHPLAGETIEKNSDDRITIVWVANLKPFKRPELFLRLARDFAEHKNVEFLMIGDAGGDRYARLLQEAERIDNLKVLGSLSLDDVNVILAQADIFVNTSSAEGFPNTFIQAWMREVPVVSMGVDVNGILEEQRGGFRAESYESLRSHVAELIGNPVTRRELGREARRIAEQRYSMKQIRQLTKILVDFSDGN